MDERVRCRAKGDGDIEVSRTFFPEQCLAGRVDWRMGGLTGEGKNGAIESRAPESHGVLCTSGASECDLVERALAHEICGEPKAGRHE